MKRSRSSGSLNAEPEPEAQSTEASSLPFVGRPVYYPQIRGRTRVKPNHAQGLAALEAGQEKITDHVGTISAKLNPYVRPTSESTSTPRLPISDFADLYRRNEHDEGCHFVIHQHDHPVAGPHYDLRLQFSKTSSVSWSIMYGLPGDPNSGKLNRNATETRIHCLWNHLIETASAKSGSLIIWDTGKYEILPYDPQPDDSRSECSDDSQLTQDAISNSAKLRQAFQNRKIRIRLHGTRLPKKYTIFLRMDKSTDYVRPIRNGPKRRRKSPQGPPTGAPSPSDSETEHSPRNRLSDAIEDEPAEDEQLPTNANSEEDRQIQINNAYPGSTNSIGSIHQRRWFLSMDRASSGFEPQTVYNKDLLGSKSRKRVWVRSPDKRGNLQGFEPFYVRGPEVERSVVTGRLGRDVLVDEEVEGFVPRKGWRAVLN